MLTVWLLSLSMKNSRNSTWLTQPVTVTFKQIRLSQYFYFAFELIPHLTFTELRMVPIVLLLWAWHDSRECTPTWIPCSVSFGDFPLLKLLRPVFSTLAVSFLDFLSRPRYFAILLACIVRKAVSSKIVLGCISYSLLIAMFRLFKYELKFWPNTFS